MKKFLAIMVVALVSLTAHAQHTPHAFGAHFGGSTIDLEYQYHFSSKNFLAVNAGVFDLDEGFSLQGVYNWNIQQWGDWTPRFGTWKLWGGFGGGLGSYSDNFFFGPVGTLGFGFTLKACPLTMGLDYRPMVAFNCGDDFSVIDCGFRNVGLSVTYRF